MGRLAMSNYGSYNFQECESSLVQVLAQGGERNSRVRPVADYRFVCDVQWANCANAPHWQLYDRIVRRYCSSHSRLFRT